MAEPINQTDKEKTYQSKTNLELILEHLKPELKTDFLKIVFGKYPTLFYAFIVLLLWQIFYDVFDGVIVKVYKYSLANIPINPITSCLFIFIAIGTIIVYRYKIKKIQYRPSLNFSFIVLFIGVIYFSLRWSGNWVFYTLWSLPIALADIYVLFLIGEIWSWVKFLSKTHPKKKISGKYFGLDDPDDNADEFGRINFATEIAEYICNSFGKRSLAIGISGSWGTGKSYLLHQIQKSLTSDPKNDNSIIVIKFNPWRSSTHNRIVEDFLQTIKKALSVYDKSLSNKFEKYLKVLIETDKTNWIKTIFDTLSISENKSSEQLYNEINGCLQLIHKKLVIFIDDLDRLHNEEIIEVFRIVRNTADFYNTCFVVAYDREYVQNSFPSTNLQMNNYLDKIFQTEFVLPTIDHIILMKVLIHEVAKRFDDKINEESVFRFILDKKNQTILLSCIQHKRDAIRFANMYSFDIMPIIKEVDGKDFLMIILLKMKYPSVYNILHQRYNRDTLLEVDNKNSKKQYKIKSSGFEELKKENQNAFSHLNPGSITIIKNLLDELFEKKRGLSINSIRFVKNYYKYFSLSISSDDLKLEEFWKVISMPFNEAKEIIDFWFSNNPERAKSKGTLEKLFLYYNISEFDNIDQLQVYIYGIKKTCTRVNVREGINQFHLALNEAGIYKEEFRKIIISETEDELDNKIVEMLFPEGTMEAFNSLFIEQLYTDGTGGNNLFSKEKCKNLVIAKFKQLQMEDAFSLLFYNWKTIISSKDFDKWDEDIFKLTNDFAEQILKNKEKFKIIIGLNLKKEKALEESNKNSAVLENGRYRKEFNILNDIEEILSTKFRHLSDYMDYNTRQNEIKNRISFFRELLIENKISYLKMMSLLDLIGPNMESNTDYKDYESKVIDIYPIKSEQFEQFDFDFFSNLKKDFHITKL